MKKKLLFALPLALLVASCGEAQSSSPAKSSAQSSSGHSGEDISYVPFDPGISSHELSHNDEPHDYDAIKVNTPKNALAEDFAFGADLSIVAEVEKNGGVYYNENGEEEDVFSILARNGVNYCRLRLWNDPYSKDGLPYGGGTNDLPTDIYLAKRAKAAGMKILLDYHYSDSWADPAKYHSPKAWADTAYSGNIARYLGDYTYWTLKAFKDAGITLDAVQIGNESNNGLAGFDTISALDIIARMVHAGVDSAKEVFPNINTLVHLTNVKSPASIWQFLDAMKEEGVGYDTVGLSYYPYWHGTLDNLQFVMDEIHDKYDKPSWIVETSYGNTDETNENCSNTYHSSNHETPGGYLTSVQGQTTQMADLISTISEVKEGYGRGVFYWEPAWLPVKGSTWASKAGQYYNDHGVDGTAEQIATYSDKSCLPAWCNQGWFSYTGKALPSVSVYKHILDADKEAEEHIVGSRAESVSVNVNLLKGVILPETAQVVTDLDALRAKPVLWNQEQVEAIKTDGDYEVEGKILSSYTIDEQGNYHYDEKDTYPYKAKVTAETNFIPDYSFEDQADGEEVPVSGDWSVETKVANAARIEAKSEGNLDGEKYFHWFSDSDNEFTLSSKIDVKVPDDYDLSTFVMAGDLPSDYEVFELWYQLGEGEIVSLDILEQVVLGWGAPLERFMTRVSAEHIRVDAPTTLTFGLHVKAKGSAWGHNDLWSFSRHKEGPAEYVADGALEDGDLKLQTVGSPLTTPWIVDKATGMKIADNEELGGKKADKYIGWWASSSFAFGFHQNIKNLEAGTYKFSFIIISDVAANYDSFEFAYSYVAGGEEKVTVVPLNDYLTGWPADGQGTVVELDVVVPADVVLTLGFSCSAKAGAWGRFTDFSLTK